MKSGVRISEDRLQITRMFDAPRERVFAAWEGPALLQQWWGCRQTTKVECTMDFRTGGHFTFRMHMEGIGDETHTGTYEIIEPEEIAYHVKFGPITAHKTIEFIAQGEQTKLILTQVGFPAPEFCHHVAQGTDEGFDKLEKLLERETELAHASGSKGAL